MLLSSISAEITKNKNLVAKNNIQKDTNDFLSVLLAAKEHARNRNKNVSTDLSILTTLATVPTAKELEKKHLQKNLSIDLSSIKADYIDGTSKKQKKAETLSRVVTLPDGTRLLLINIEINGRTIQLSMKLSSNPEDEDQLFEENIKENPNQAFEPENTSIGEDSSLMLSGMPLDMMSK